MPTLTDMPHEIIALIARSVQQSLVGQPDAVAPKHLQVRRSPGKRTERILQPPDLAAWARACHCFHVILVPILYDFNRVVQSSSAVAWAAQNGCIPVLEKAVQYGLSVNVVRNLYMTRIATGPYYNVLKDPVQHVHPVQFAVAQGHTDTVTWFLDHGLNVNATFFSPCPCLQRYTPLLHAALCGHQQTVARVLMERGALLTYYIYMGLVPQRNEGKRPEPNKSALHEAATLGQNDVLEYLVLDRKVDIRSQDFYNNSVLICAMSSSEMVTTVQKLLELGAPVVERHTKWEDSALCYAITKGYLRSAEIILQACRESEHGIPRVWCTKALLCTVLKTTPFSNVHNYDSEVDSETSSCVIKSPSRSHSRLRSTSSAHFTSNSVSNSASDSESSSNSDSGSDSDSLTNELGYNYVEQLEPQDPWNIQRTSFMRTLIQTGVDFTNNGKPILTFSQEAWLTRFLLDSGADPNMPRRNKDQICGDSPLSLIFGRRYRNGNTKMWMENAQVLMEYGAQIDQPGSKLDRNVLYEAVIASIGQHRRSKLPFLLHHYSVTQEQLDEILQLCFRRRLVEECRRLTEHGARGTPSKDAIYEMAMVIIKEMKKEVSYEFPARSDDSSSSNDSRSKDGKLSSLAHLSFLLRYNLPPVHGALLLGHAIKQRKTSAAHVLLDDASCQHQEAEVYITQLLILAADGGDLGIVRRLCSMSQDSMGISIALHAAIRANRRAVISFLVGRGANAIEAIPTKGYECLPDEEHVLKMKEKGISVWYYRQIRKRGLRLEDPMKAFSAMSHPVSALQLAVYVAERDVLDDILRRLDPQPGDGVPLRLHVPCVMEDAEWRRNVLIEKGFLEEGAPLAQDSIHLES